MGVDAHELVRSLSGRHVTMISLGGVVGAGLFVGSSVVITKAGPASCLSYVIAGILMFLVIRMLAEMAINYPQVRAFADFPRLALGHWGGFVTGWVYWYFWVITIPIEAIAGAKIIADWLPGMPPLAIGLVLMAVMTAVNLMPARTFGEVEFWFASIKVSAVMAFIVVATSYACGLGGQKAGFAALTHHGGFAPHGYSAVLIAVATVFFSISGAEITMIAAAEAKQGSEALAAMANNLALRIVLFFVTSVFCIVLVVPWTAVRSGASPFTLALASMGFQWAERVMGVIILTAVLSCLNSAVYICSRVMFSLAAHGDAAPWMARLSSAHVPTRTVWAGAVIGVLGLVLNYKAPQFLFAFLVSSCGALVVVVYALVCLSQVVLRRRREATGVAGAPLRMWLFPYLSYFVLLTMFAVLVALVADPDSRAEVELGGTVLAVVALAYVLRRRFGVAHRFVLPEPAGTALGE